MALEDFIPIPVEDFNTTYSFEKPPARFANIDLIFKENEKSVYYLFDNTGQWNKDTMNLPELHFDNVFDERKWMDLNNPYS